MAAGNVKTNVGNRLDHGEGAAPQVHRPLLPFEPTSSRFILPAKTRTLIDKVHTSSLQQAQSIDEISKTLVQMGSLTQRTAVNAKEARR